MVGTRGWSVSELRRHYAAFGSLPFSISGGSPENDDAGGGTEGNDADPLAKLDDKAKAAIEERVKAASNAAATAARRDAEKVAKDLQTKLSAIEGSTKTEAEKLAARLKVLEDDNASKTARLRDRDAESIVTKAATKAGAPDADVVYRYLRSDIQFDDDGKPTNVAELLRELKEDKPSLFKKTAGPADAGGGNGSKPTDNSDWVRGALQSRRGG